MTARQILVVGAGMVGVCTAWHLRTRGHEVTLIDRRDPGSETSYGNAGLIQREAVKPHPFPRALTEILRVLPDQSIDIRYRAGAMVSERAALWEYWRKSTPESFAKIVPEYASLIVHCTEDHETMFTAARATELIRRDGWLQLYRSDAAFEAGLAEAADIRSRFGVEFAHIDRQQLHEMEPFLSVPQPIIGAIHWTNAWSVSDPGALVKAYAADYVKRGGKMLRMEVHAMEPAGERWHVSSATGESIDGDELVLATGPWSREWFEALGYRIPLFVQRGYHMHYGASGGAVLNHGIMDFERGYLITPKRAGLRITTGAELNTLEAAPRYGQLDAAENAAREIFPLGARKEPKPWLGARPCIADMKPVIGPAHKHPHLWFAFGHAHQGFTLGPTTGRLLAQMIDGETPAVDMRPFRSDRFED
ncbi:MAG TPA: FAD-dependent oxidoreductase [Nevskiaceae bacterium]